MLIDEFSLTKRRIGYATSSNRRNGKEQPAFHFTASKPYLITSHYYVIIIEKQKGRINLI